MLKPEVVLFGEQVPKRRVARASQALEESDAMLVAGSSLMVFSGYRFARAAVEHGIPLVLVNLGRTRTDGEATVKVTGRCGEVLSRLSLLEIETQNGASREPAPRRGSSSCPSLRA